MTERTYLDWNATAPLRPEAREAMAAALSTAGNPSSVHGEGRAARKLVEEAREAVAALVGAEPRNVVFTSGGTEANMTALSPRTGGGCTRLLVSAMEHPSVLAGGRFAPGQVEQIPVTSEGDVNLAALRQRLATPAQAGERPLVAVMVANNETGVVQPISQVAEITHEAGGLLHADAVQASGKIAFNINGLQADLISISAHKIGGPKGIGALIRRDEALMVDPLIRGGGQERSHRGGTENVLGIVGFGAASHAAKANLATEQGRIAALRDRLETRLRAVSADVVIFGAARERLPNTTLFAVPGIRAETAVIALDLDGIAVSSGAACSSGKVQASHVLTAMGIEPALARGEIRVSLGPASTESDIERFLEAWIKLSGALLKTREIAA